MDIQTISRGILEPSEVNGNEVLLKKSLPKHLTKDGSITPFDQGDRNFADLLVFDSLKEVSDSQNKASDLMQLAAIDPSSVNSEDVTIAMAQAELSLGMTKAVVDRAIRAYQEILSFR